MMAKGATSRDRPSKKSVPLLGTQRSCKYVQRRMIGKGAYGEAWLAQRVSDGELFVAKILDLRESPERRRRYALNEIRCLARCDHPNVIKYIEDNGEETGVLVIIMELANAGDLATQIKRNGVVFSEKEVGVAFVQLIMALNHIHERRMIHRDIKTANLMLSNTGIIKVGDFGFSQTYDDTVSKNVAGTFLGTPYYLAPEMWQGKRYGKKADIFAAGVVLYELLANRRPYTGQSIHELKSAVLTGSIHTIPTVSRDMDAVVRACLEPDPSKRPSAAALLRMHLLQHYISTYLNITSRDPKLPSETKHAIAQSILSTESSIKHELSLDTAISTQPNANDFYFEAVVMKQTGERWRNRILIIDPPELILTLLHGKEAMPGTERSKRISFEIISNVLPLNDQDERHCKKFAVYLVGGAALVFGLETADERNNWIDKLQSALEM